MTGLEVIVQERGDVAVLRCSGHIRFGDGANELRHAVNSQSNSCVVIDLSGVEKIDAAGIGVLVELNNGATYRNQTLQITNPTRRVRQVLDITGVSSVLQVSSERKIWKERDYCLWVAPLIPRGRECTRVGAMHPVLIP